MKKKKQIVLCSSAAFYKQGVGVEQDLKRLGFAVAVPITMNTMKRNGDFRVERYKTWWKDAKTYSRKAFLTRHHFLKIAKGDAILVLNYEKNGRKGYIGGAVLAEMAVAFYLKKPIYILNPIDESVSYKEELLGMLPKVLDGDLSSIPR